MLPWLTFGAGFMVGGMLGFFVFALLSMAADESDRRDELEREGRCWRHDEPSPCLECIVRGRLS